MALCLGRFLIPTIASFIKKNCFGPIICTATAIPFIYSFSGNSAASAPISTFMCRWAIYIFPGSVYNISSSRTGRPIVGIYNSLTDTWMWKLGLRLRYSFSGNICFQFSAFCLCSVCFLLNANYHVFFYKSVYLVPSFETRGFRIPTISRKQSCRSVTFWYGSGSGSGSGSFFAYYFLKLHLHHFSKTKSPESTKQQELRFFLLFCLIIERSGSGSVPRTNPDPDQDPGGLKIYGSYAASEYLWP